MADSVASARMNGIYRHQRHVYDITRKFYLLGRDDLIERLAAQPGQQVIEIGCGTGRNLILAAQRYPDARFYGVDVSTEMLTSARQSIERSELSMRVRVAHGDATMFNSRSLFGTAQFDHVFISYTLSMIPQWHATLTNAVRLLAPKGELHIVDFGGQSGLPGWFRDGLRWWLAQFHVTPRDGLGPVLKTLARDNSLDLSVEHPFRDYAVYARLTRRG